MDHFDPFVFTQGKLREKFLSRPRGGIYSIAFKISQSLRSFEMPPFFAGWHSDYSMIIEKSNMNILIGYGNRKNRLTCVLYRPIFVPQGTDAFTFWRCRVKITCKFFYKNLDSMRGRVV